MALQDLEQFYVLKKEIERTYRAAHPASVHDIHDWKGQDIVNFQEHLQATVNGRISEKWFYTHIKTHENARLPRIDMLNLLSAYVGYTDWQGFQYAHQNPIPVEPEGENDLRKENKIWIVGIASVFAIGLLIWAFTSPESVHHFCFTDATTGKAITEPLVEVWILEDGESPQKIPCDKQGCMKIKSSKGSVKFVVSAPYYHTDTITRKLVEAGEREDIDLRTDDYAMMIHYFSADKQKDWGKRRKQLQDIFSDKARIFQVSPNNELGMELYNKQEFIDKLTTPIRSLGQIEVLETNYEQGKIVSMRFIQKENP